MAETTPMMQQYNRIKEQHRDAVLFFRLGDFYEMFKQDAVEVSRLLQLTLTHRNGIPMCGIPYHAAEGYINRLLQAGKKIAVCEQITLPSGGKNLADRQVVEIITPGTAIREGFADSRQNNFLVSVGRRGNSVSICWADVGGSDLTVSSVPLEDAPTAIRSHLYRLQTRELLMQESLLEETGPMKQILEDRDDILVNRYPDWSFDQTESLHLLKKQFCVENLKGFGLSDEDPALFAAGILIDYLRETTRSKLPHLRNLRRFQEEGYLSLDESTLRNLEILHNMHDGSEQYTLLKTIDFTATAMGKRRIRNWLVRPLTDKEAIEERLNNVSRLHSDQLLLSQIQDQLREIRDLERLGARMEMDRTNPKELAALRSSLHTSAGLESLLKGWRKQSYFWTDDQVESNQLHTLLELLDRALEDDPPVMISEGKCIRSGYHEELDALREMKNDSSRILDDYLEEQKQRSGIHSLKLKYNKIIGYFLEVTKSNADRVPDDFLRKQQLVGSERYTTNRLIELETAINNASEKIGELEKHLFTHVCKKVRSYAEIIQKIADAVSYLDVIQSFAWASTVHGYTQPEITDSGRMKVEKGRHPVVEAHLAGGSFVPNSLDLGGSEEKNERIALITGPNMAGKSTFLRQTALITLMAQAGSFIPAESGRLPVTSKIFCRVGASDNLARGESTFLVEMNETSFILRNADSRSLIIMDEVGRGTSTNDGLAIAWAVVEYLIQKSSARTLFATHYHELTAIENPAIQLLFLDAIEEDDNIIFLKTVKRGAVKNSYGIQVARLAGVPGEVIHRARDVLASLEQREHLLVSDPASRDGKQKPATSGSTGQSDLFSSEEMLINEISAFPVNESTPLEALNAIQRWKKLLS